MKTIPVCNEIFLRQPTLEDARVLFELVDNNRAHLGRYLPWVRETRSVEDTVNYIQSIDNSSFYSGRYSNVIVYNSEIVGCVGFGSGSSNFHKKLEIGYWLAKKHVGKGIATKSVAATIEHAVNTSDVNRIELRCSTRNFKSQAISERLGFMRECVERQGFFVNGQFVDNNYNSVLRDEWESQKLGKRYIEAVTAS